MINFVRNKTQFEQIESPWLYFNNETAGLQTDI